MLKIGVGPSSSHTLGPWRAAMRFIDIIALEEDISQLTNIKIDLYGSLSLTGKGHATDIAVVMGLCGNDPKTFPVEQIQGDIDSIQKMKKIPLTALQFIDFDWDKDIVFQKKFLPFHPNGMTITGIFKTKKRVETFFSIGGGFVVQKERKRAKKKHEIFQTYPYPIENGADLLKTCAAENKRINEIIFENELSPRIVKTK